MDDLRKSVAAGPRFRAAAGQKAAGGGIESEGEDVRVCTFPRARVIEMLSQGKIAEAKTIVALMWLRDKLATMTPW
jgi:hypothetical protein